LWIDRTLKTESLSTEISAALTKLTLRELKVIRLIASGANNKEIAQAFYISERTVKNHVTSILSRLNLCDRTQTGLLASDYFRG
jgi:DNA-binding NarL/FixJ family response regulator